MKILAGILLLCGVAWAGEIKTAKLQNVQSYQVQNNSVLGRWARSDGGSAVIPDSRRVVALTVLLDDIAYTANFMGNKQLPTESLVIGDPIPIRLDKDKMFIKGINGKELRGYIIRRERVTSTSAAK